MTVKFVHDIGFRPCKSVFSVKLGDKNLLPQCQEVEDFVVSQGISDVGYATGTKHTMIKLIVNGEYVSLTELGERIIRASHSATKYLYLAINKFMIYSEQDQTSGNSTDYDHDLVQYCYDLVKQEFKLLKCHYDSQDMGTSGNFIYPITTLFLERYEQR